MQVAKTNQVSVTSFKILQMSKERETNKVTVFQEKKGEKCISNMVPH